MLRPEALEAAMLGHCRNRTRTETRSLRSRNAILLRNIPDHCSKCRPRTVKIDINNGLVKIVSDSFVPSHIHQALRKHRLSYRADKTVSLVRSFSRRF